MKFLHVGPDDLLKLSMKLADMVRESDFRPDVIVGVLRGGSIVARLMSDFLDVRDVRCVRVVHYDALEIKDRIQVTEPLPTRLDGKKVLLVDDVADTGESLIVARDHLLERGAQEVRILTLHYKPWSKLRPDYYAEETDAWVVYFWEYAETVRYFFQREGQKGYEHVLNILRQAGVPLEIVRWVAENEGYV